jgi:hypothetical protein
MSHRLWIDRQTKMFSLRLAIPVVLFAAIVAACLTYFVTLPLPPVEPERPAIPALPSRVLETAAPKKLTDDEEKTVAAFQRAADVILKRAENLQAAVTPDLPIRGRIPLPRKRPIPR